MKSALADLYRAHVAERQQTTERALAETGFDRLLLHSGIPHTYFADDNDAPFHPTPHFAHWAPVEGPGHVLEVRPGQEAAAREVPAARLLVRAAAPGTRLRRGRDRGRRHRDARRPVGRRRDERRADRVPRRGGGRGRRPRHSRRGGQPEGARVAARLGALVQERLRGGDARRGDRPRRARLPRRRGRVPRGRDRDGGAPRLPRRRGRHGDAAPLPDDHRLRRALRDAPLPRQAGDLGRAREDDARRRGRRRPRLRLRHHPDLRG